MPLSLDTSLCTRRMQELASEGFKLRECAYNLLHELILSHQLKSGTPLVERELESAFGISRTPLRQAIERLEGQGLVSRVTERMACVKVVTLDEYLQALDMRLLLEVKATKLCVNRISSQAFNEVTEFIEQSHMINDENDKHWKFDSHVHSLISNNCGNKFMQQSIERMRVICNLYEEVRTNYIGLPGWKEHMGIFTSLKERDGDTAAYLMEEHLRCVKQRLIGSL